VLVQGLLPIALFFFMYWILGGFRWLRRPGWPRTLRWLGAALVAAWMIAILRGGFVE
jgi:heme A synthase